MSRSLTDDDGVDGPFNRAMDRAMATDAKPKPAKRAARRKQPQITKAAARYFLDLIEKARAVEMARPSHAAQVARDSSFATAWVDSIALASVIGALSYYADPIGATAAARARADALPAKESK